VSGDGVEVIDRDVENLTCAACRSMATTHCGGAAPSRLAKSLAVMGTRPVSLRSYWRNQNTESRQ
jgi:hypothetical protein